MKGTLRKTERGWTVAIIEEGDWSTYYPLHPDDVKQINRDAQVFDNIEARIAAYPDVEFDWCVILDHDTGKGIEYAKLKQTKEYPELEGTNELCKDVIAARANESVPAPGDSETELRRVRRAKQQHVKEQNWELAAAYREIEKLLQEREPKCANCQYMLSAVGVGQGLICELNRCRIPHSEHSCQYHWRRVTKSAENASFDTPQT